MAFPTFALPLATQDPEEKGMIPPRDIIRHVGAEPFRPFRIHTASGRGFEVRHPEFVQVGRNTVTVFAPSGSDPGGQERWEQISYMLIESIAPLNVPVGPDGQ